jgi:hypothetical protein
LPFNISCKCKIVNEKENKSVKVDESTYLIESDSVILFSAELVKINDFIVDGCVVVQMHLALLDVCFIDAFL